MAIKIQTERTDIPVEIGDLKFSFDTSDESILKFRKKGKEVAEELKNIEINEDDEEEEIIKRAKEILQTGFEIMLGKGAFEKIYDLSPSIAICTSYFYQLSEASYKELNDMGLTETQKEKAKKYLQNKNKNKK